jgi:hypothetical protein
MISKGGEHKVNPLEGLHPLSGKKREKLYLDRKEFMILISFINCSISDGDREFE